MKKFLLFSLVLAPLFELNAQVVMQNRSKTPALVTINTAGFPNVQGFGLISSVDTLAATPAFRFAGSADGAGVLKNSDGTYTMLVNNEDNFSVSRIILDSTFTPVKGDYIMNSNAGMWRLCSGTMATPEEHGFGPLFITCGESSIESMTHTINPFGNAVTDSNVSALTTLAGFGRWSAENAVPLPKTLYPNKTVVLIGDDDSGPNGGQVAMYVGNAGDLNNGAVYVLRKKNLNQSERNIPVGSTIDVEFVKVNNHKSLTGDQLNKISDTTLKSIKFGRVEDIDYRKGSPASGREIYFNVTGAQYTGTDSINKTIFGRVYRLILNASDPLQGTLECILDGDNKSSLGAPLYNPDNICVTEDYVYVAEDPNGYTMPWALPYVHDARLYQYDIESKTFTTLVEFDHHRSAADSATYNRNSAGTAYAKSGIGSWEFGAMVDVSKETGINNAFVLALQPHTFRYAMFAGVDGGTLRPTENQGSMMITLTNVPRVKAKAPSSANVSACYGSTATLTASGGSTFSTTNGTTYKWYSGPSGGSALATSTTYTTPVLTANATYYVASFVSGMESPTRTQVNVTVYNKPVVSLGADKQVCEKTTLDAFVSGGASYAWSTGANTSSIEVNKTGIYSVAVNQNGCTGRDTIYVQVNAKSETPVITVQAGTILKSNKTTGNKWYKNGTLVSTSQSYTVTTNGDYSLTYTDAGGCESEPAMVTYNNLGVADAFEKAGFRLFPNPNDGSFTLRYESKETKRLSIQVVSVSGQLVYLEELSDFNGTYDKTIDLSGSPAGNYIVNIVTDNTVVQKKVVKQ